jgi:cobalt-zinc-cadmium efflux system membrane fusion protein
MMQGDSLDPAIDQSPVSPPLPPTKSSRTRVALVSAGLAIAVVGTVFVMRRSAPAEADAPARDVPYLDGKAIRFSAAFAERSHIKVQKPVSGTLSPQVTVVGTVDFDPEHVAAIGARIAGRVRRVLKYEGDPVKAGEALAEVESTELAQAQASLSAARAHADAAIANEKREQSLAEARVSSQREAEMARATALAAKAEVTAANQKVRALGGSAGGELGILILTSPIDGKVVERKVARGQSVEPTFTAFRVADLHHVWVNLAVFERQVSHVREGDKVEIVSGLGAQPLTGKVAHVGDVIDLETKSADVRVEVETTEQLHLRPGQSVTARIHTRSTPQPALTVPLDAVTAVDGKPTLFVAKDATSVEPRTVTLGGRDKTSVEVLQGLGENEDVVVAGVFALKSEVFR